MAKKIKDFFVKEFIPSVEKLCRIKSAKRYRGIAGLSMGGYGALSFSFKYPGLFAALQLSAGIFDDNGMVTMPDKNWAQTFGQLFGYGLKGNERLNKVWYNNSILKIAETKPADSMERALLD